MKIIERFRKLTKSERLIVKAYYRFSGCRDLGLLLKIVETKKYISLI